MSRQDDAAKALGKIAEAREAYAAMQAIVNDLSREYPDVAMSEEVVEEAGNYLVYIHQLMEQISRAVSGYEEID